jgi:hypothetical protein
LFRYDLKENVYTEVRYLASPAWGTYSMSSSVRYGWTEKALSVGL